VCSGETEALQVYPLLEFVEMSGNGTPRGTLSPTDRAAIWQAHGRRCAYTSDQISFNDLEIDHIIPVSISSEELDRLKAEDVIASCFDLNGFCNLLPTTRFQNSRKRANLRNKSALLHFLAVAEQYRASVEQYIRASSGDDRSLNAYLRIKAQAERNDITVEDIVDIHRQQADGITRLRHIPELVGTGETTLLNADLARTLMNKPFALGGGSITEVVLQDDAGSRTFCGDCASFLAAKAKRLQPRTQLDITFYGMASRNCEMLRALERARYAPASLIRYPRITCKNLDRWSASWVRRVWVGIDEAEDGALFARCKSIADLVSDGACRVVTATDWNFDVVPVKGLALSLTELFRADLDNDGAEEILVFDLTYAPQGSLRAGSVTIARPTSDGLLYPDDAKANRT
jgi:HNH endonuclease